MGDILEGNNKQVGRLLKIVLGGGRVEINKILLKGNFRRVGQS